jgi:hypothetical protein
MAMSSWLKSARAAALPVTTLSAPKRRRCARSFAATAAVAIDDVAAA